MVYGISFGEFQNSSSSHNFLTRILMFSFSQEFYGHPHLSAVLVASILISGVCCVADIVIMVAQIKS